MRTEQDRKQITCLIEEEGDEVDVRIFNEEPEKDKWEDKNIKDDDYSDEKETVLDGWSKGKNFPSETNYAGRFEDVEKMFITFHDSNLSSGDDKIPASRIKHNGKEYIVKHTNDRYEAKFLFCERMNRDQEITG